MSVVTASAALLTDHYELTMVQAARQSGTAGRRAVFELFPRRLPAGRRYGVVAGVGRALDALEDFRFDAAALTAFGDEQGWPVIDVTRRSIEETAATVLQLMEAWHLRQKRGAPPPQPLDPAADVLGGSPAP